MEEDEEELCEEGGGGEGEAHEGGAGGGGGQGEGDRGGDEGVGEEGRGGPVKRQHSGHQSEDQRAACERDPAAGGARGDGQGLCACGDQGVTIHFVPLSNVPGIGTAS